MNKAIWARKNPSWPHCQHLSRNGQLAINLYKMIVCAAVVGQQNQPLYLRTFPAAEGEALLKFHYIVHCSLDAVEEKGAWNGHGQVKCLVGLVPCRLAEGVALNAQQ